MVRWKDWQELNIKTGIHEGFKEKFRYKSVGDFNNNESWTEEDYSPIRIKEP